MTFLHTDTSAQFDSDELPDIKSPQVPTRKMKSSTIAATVPELSVDASPVFTIKRRPYQPKCSRYSATAGPSPLHSTPSPIASSLDSSTEIIPPTPQASSTPKKR